MRDNFHGEPINLKENWHGYPDWYDLKKIISHANDFMFPSRGRTSVCSQSTVDAGQTRGDSPDADFIAAANPATVQALIDALRAERKKNQDCVARGLWQ